MNNSFGKRFSDLRKAKGYTQEDIASRLNVSSQAVSKWENDISYPDISLLCQIADIFEVTVDFLLGKGANEAPVVLQEKPKDINKMLFKVVVNSNEGDKVRVNLPLALIKVGLASGISFGDSKGNDIMKNIDWQQLLSLVEQGVIGKLVEVQSADGDLVEVYVE